MQSVPSFASPPPAPLPRHNKRTIPNSFNDVYLFTVRFGSYIAIKVLHLPQVATVKYSKTKLKCTLDVTSCLLYVNVI